MYCIYKKQNVHTFEKNLLKDCKFEIKTKMLTTAFTIIYDGVAYWK